MTKSILLIDDDKVLRTTIAEFLTSEGYTVIEAENGFIGADLLNKNRVSLVITDILMPERDGLSIIMKVRDSFPNTPVIAMSGGNSFQKFDTLKYADALGADKILPKPFKIRDLAEAVKKTIA